MKKLAVILLQLFIPVLIQGQVNICNTSLIDSTLNYLYKGVDNRLLINGLKDTSSIYFSSDNALKPVNRVKYWHNNSFQIKIDTLRLIHKDSILFEKVFQVGIIPNPQVQLGEISKDTVSIEEVVDQDELRVFLPNCFLDFYAVVTSFELKLIVKNDRNYIFDVNGSGLQSMHKFIVRTMQPGDQLRFTNIIAQGGMFCPRVLEDITYTIK